MMLLGDIGGTNVRLAVYEPGRLGRIAHLQVADHPDPLRLFHDFLAGAAPGRRPEQAAFAVAGPVAADGRSVRVTNNPWRIDADEIERSLGIRRVRLINDFAAIAWSLLRLTGDDLMQIGGGAPVAGAPRTVLGPGTGLGVAHLLTVDGAPVVLASEGGHATIAAADAEEGAILDHIRDRYGHVSGERVLAGDGLLNLHQAVAALGGREPHAETPETVTAHALEDCPDCRRAVDLFFAMLGGFAGNLALIIDARGGTFVAGGIVPRLADLLEGSRFRQHFEAKGRHRRLLRHMPTYLIRKPDVAFDGLIAMAER